MKINGRCLKALRVLAIMLIAVFMFSEAKQTNIDRVEAARDISEKLALQIAGMF